MIRTWRRRGLKRLFLKGGSRYVRPDLQGRARLVLDAMDAAEKPSDLNIPGFNFHGLKGHRPMRYSIHVNGPWCVTFEFWDGDAYAVDLEQYH